MHNLIEKPAKEKKYHNVNETQHESSDNDDKMNGFAIGYVCLDVWLLF